MLKRNKQIPVLECNCLTVNHYFQIGSLYASCKKVKDLSPDDTVLVLEKINNKTEAQK